MKWTFYFEHSRTLKKLKPLNSLIEKLITPLQDLKNDSRRDRLRGTANAICVATAETGVLQKFESISRARCGIRKERVWSFFPARVGPD